MQIPFLQNSNSNISNFRNDRLVGTALVNKGVALLQWKNDPSAQALIEQALELDPGNEVAVATLSQIYLNSGDLENACKMFEKQIEISRNPAELNNAIGFKAVSRIFTLKPWG